MEGVGRARRHLSAGTAIAEHEGVMDRDDDEHAAFDEEEGWVCVWAGDLTPVQLREYRRERETDDEWTSGLREDIGGFYDHDYLSSMASETPTTVRALVDALGFRSQKYPPPRERSAGARRSARELCRDPLVRARPREPGFAHVRRWAPRVPRVLGDSRGDVLLAQPRLAIVERRGGSASASARKRNAQRSSRVAAGARPSPSPRAFAPGMRSLRTRRAA